MSMHAAYYISLVSKDPGVRKRSKDRLIRALKFAPMMGVKRIVFHAGGYSGHGLDEAYILVRDAISDVWETAGREAGGAILMPEVAGKLGAFGSVDELVKLCQELDGVLPTIDWAHLYARSQGAMKNKEDYLRTLNKFEHALGKPFTDNLHFHVSGITYSAKGEKSHRPLGKDWGPDLLPLMEIVDEVGYKPTFISETPAPLTGALFTKFLLEELKRSKK
jgi:deoxyribonuclease-4